MVLKLEGGIHEGIQDFVSVPLRGCGFEIKQMQWSARGKIVSVPLRGCGFEIALCQILDHRDEGFRPLAGVWF